MAFIPFFCMAADSLQQVIDNVYIREYVANTRNLLDECYFSSVTDTMGEWLLISFGW